MSGIELFVVTLTGYLIGSISFAVLIAKSQGVDIFQVGSGNPGATNVKRTLGSKWGNTVFALDALKGFVAAGWPMLWLCGSGDAGLRLGIVGLVAAILGHSYSVFLKFRGGKGVATTMGGLLAVMPQVLLLGLLAWLIIYYASKIVALASILFALSLPVSAYFFYDNSGGFDPRLILATLLALLIILRHRANIVRLLRGEENSFKK